MDSATLSRHRIFRTISLLILTSFILGLFAFSIQSTAAQTSPTASDKAYGWLQAQQLPNGLVDSFEPVSYTHLDVYKRQAWSSSEPNARHPAKRQQWSAES